MPLGAKILAFLNMLIAGLFVYLAAIDWGARQAGSRATFLRELALDGLPLDEQDTGRRPDRPLVNDLGGDDSAIVAELFDPRPDLRKRSESSPWSTPAVITQDREVERARVETMKALDAIKDETERRTRIKELLLAQARTFDEREELLEKKINNKNVSTDDLKKLLNDRFEDALRDVSYTDDRDATDRNILAKRRIVAHLLYNLIPQDQAELANWHQRVMIVVGLKRYVEEADSQAQALVKMITRVKSAALDEQNNFEAEFLRQRDRILVLSQAVERQQVALKNLEDLHKRQQNEIIVPLTKRKKELEDELDKQRADISDVLGRQDKLESELFVIHREIGKFLTTNQKLEREIRLMELGPVRGGQR